MELEKMLIKMLATLIIPSEDTALVGGYIIVKKIEKKVLMLLGADR